MQTPLTHVWPLEQAAHVAPLKPHEPADWSLKGIHGPGLPFPDKQQPCGQLAALQTPEHCPPWQIEPGIPVQSVHIPLVPHALLWVPGWQLPLLSQQPLGHSDTQAPPEQHIPACAQEPQIPLTQAGSRSMAARKRSRMRHCGTVRPRRSRY